MTRARSRQDITKPVDITTEAGLLSHLRHLIDTSEQYLDEQSPDRQRVLEMYNGDMRNDIKTTKNRSKVVSEDIRMQVKKAMPAMMRTLLGNDHLVTFDALSQEGIQAMDQATEYMNLVVLPESDAEDAIYDSIFDAHVIKTGILKTSAYKTSEVKFSEHSGKTEADLVGVEGEPDLEILDRETAEDGTLSYTIKETIKRVEPRLEAVERGRFLISPGTKSIKESALTGEFDELTRSELISRGYDRDAVESLGVYHFPRSEDDDKSSREGNDYSDIRVTASKSMELCRVYDVCVWLDLDDDGIAELHNFVLGEGRVTEKKSNKGGRAQLVILDQELMEESPYHDVKVERDAHQFEGHSVAEDLVDQQRVNTTLLREVLNNIYASNLPQPAIDEDAITADGLDSVMNPEFGKPIRMKGGADVQKAIQWQAPPFFADKGLDMIEWMRQDGEDKTQITDRSAGASPEALSTMSAAGANLLNDKGVAGASYMIRTVSRGGLRSAMLALLKLHIQHCDKEREVQVDNEWRVYNPSLWRNVEMKCKINVGLGTGSRERDLQIVQMVYGLQREILANMGPENPYVTPEQFYNTLEMFVESTGLPSADPYFTKPDPIKVQEWLEKQGQQAAQAAQVEQQKMQQQAQLEDMKNRGRIAIEQAQMQADERVRTVEAKFQADIEAIKANHKAEIERMKLDHDWAKHTDDIELGYAKLDLDVMDKAANHLGQTPQIETNGAVNERMEN